MVQMGMFFVDRVVQETMIGGIDLDEDEGNVRKTAYEIIPPAQDQ